jgi:radical SAM superfamily enzyme YgiQ (UPF0313 family)
MTAETSRKRNVYFCEFNVLMERAAYLPLVSGILRCYAEKHAALETAYAFRPFLFLRQSPEAIVDQMLDPDIVCFSTSMWNEQLNLRVGALLKDRHPNCLTVFGGPQVPHFPTDYFANHPFIDVAVRGDGERPFVAILERYRESADFRGIPNVAFRDRATGECVRNEGEFPIEKDLDEFPSPYVEGVFDSLFETQPEIDFQAIVETNRGCPFLCAFCFWGQGGLSRKFRYHSLERVRAEIEWAARHRIKYMFNADSNFGMHKRDDEIAEILVETKAKYGYPEKFRTCFGKNTDERIFSIGLKMHKHGLEKGITLSRQSMDPTVLEFIERDNIKMSTYRYLQEQFNEYEIPVYTELILGLPGESYDSWLNGIDDLLCSGLKNQLFIYPAQVYPNTTLGDPEYMRKHGVKTSRIRLTEIHAKIRPDDGLPEFEDIVVELASMSNADWRRMLKFSWVVMALHSLKLGYFILMYMADRYGIRYRDLISFISDEQVPRDIAPTFYRELGYYDAKIDDIMAGKGRACELPQFGGIYWDVEEATVLRVCENLDGFYDEFRAVLEAFLVHHGIAFDPEELGQAVAFQRMRFPAPAPPSIRTREFTFNFPEYFEAGHLGKPVTLEPAQQTLTLNDPRDFSGDLVRYAREVILWGRKSDRLLERAAWQGDAAGQPKVKSAEVAAK